MSLYEIKNKSLGSSGISKNSRETLRQSHVPLPCCRFANHFQSLCDRRLSRNSASVLKIVSEHDLGSAAVSQIKIGISLDL
jgi:hypothetical protein